MNTTAITTNLIFEMIERRFKNGTELEPVSKKFLSQDALNNARDLRIARLIINGYHFDDNQDDGVGYTMNRADGVYHVKLEGYSRVCQTPVVTTVQTENRTCEKCGGSGLWRGQWKTGKCFACDGRGTVAKKKEYQLDMPTGSSTKSPVVEPIVNPTPETVAIRAEIKEATYTVVDPSLKHGRRTLKISERSFGGEKKMTVSFLSGGDNEGDYIGAAFIDLATARVTVWKKFRDSEFETELKRCIDIIAGDPRAGMEAYALESSKCACCGRKLTVPASIHQGLGPKCAAKMGY